LPRLGRGGLSILQGAAYEASNLLNGLLDTASIAFV